MTKVAISANTSWYLYNFRKNTITFLLSQGCEVVTVAPVDAYTEKLEALGVKHYDVFIDQNGSRPLKDIVTFLHFLRVFNQSSPDFVLNFTPKNNIYGTLAAKLSGSKVINNVAGLGVGFTTKGFIYYVSKLLYKCTQRFADIVFFQNEDDKILFLRKNIIREEQARRLPGSGVDIVRFTPKKAQNDGVIRFLLIARLIAEKGVYHYVEAAESLKQVYGDKVEFSLLGFLDTSSPSAITNQQMDVWVERGIVKYLGVSDQVEKEIAPIDCIVLPSFYREGVPKTLLEAGAMGKPIVTTNSVGCRETVDNGINGFLCQPRDTQSLLEQLEKIIVMSEAERESLGAGSRQKMIHEFSEEIILNKYWQAITDLKG
ncbi:glycosyltransferase family 4 protein [Vibrio sp. FNV 38]|nr:glycosyltransferase family 4 protein [Vibrio sp. FNV 38]